LGVTLRVTVSSDLDTGVTIVTPVGLLDVRSSRQLRAVLRKCLADGPAAVIVCLDRLRVDRWIRLTIFNAAATGQDEPRTPLMLAGPSDDLAAQLSRDVTGGSAVFASCASAVAAVVRAHVRAVQRVDVRLPPTAAAVRTARQITEQACIAWGMGLVADRARFIAGELVANAVEHARTGSRLVVAVRGRFLHLRVSDEGPGQPTTLCLDPESGMAGMRRGRGLHLVNLFSAAWGVTPGDSGKTVWAIVTASPSVG
jgi:anti-sigma regulatory factor (Ser/Thr protein kinase)